MLTGISRKGYYKVLIIIFSGALAAALCQSLAVSPKSRDIHIRNFRYGKAPWIIRCNRGDTLHLTFSSDDTGHSFFLEEFDVDAKVNGSSDEIALFRPSDPTIQPEFRKEVVIVMNQTGLKNILFSRFNYRCHVWCGPMHAFEQGKLIVFPDTLLFFSLGSLLAIVVLWVFGFRIKSLHNDTKSYPPSWIKKILVSRWPQIIFMVLALFMITIVIITSVLGTKVSGRNLGVLLMWSVWLFLLITVLTPLGGRVWCTICPLPVFGDLVQRGSLFLPLKGKTGEYNNRFFGLFKKWPARLDNNWLRIVLFMVLATFSTTLVAIPRISGLTIITLCALPVFFSLIWELRSFCRYVCPVHAFVGPFSKMSILALRNRSQEVCDKCIAKYCKNGNSMGWACPYGLNVGELKDSSYCGLCLECMRSCTYGNVTIVKRKFCSEEVDSHISNSWLNIAIFSIAIIYSILYLGPWPQVRDWVNILDKQNWSQFGIYSVFLWLGVLVILPGVIWILASAGKKFSGLTFETKSIFKNFSWSLLPLGLMLWISFVIPMLFVNVTFIKQSLSDPFGWGWDFFGTANTPWHQFLPQYIPWMQAVVILSGLYLSLRNLSASWENGNLTVKQRLIISLPQALFLIVVSISMIFFFTS